MSNPKYDDLNRARAALASFQAHPPTRGHAGYRPTLEEPLTAKYDGVIGGYPRLEVLLQGGDGSIPYTRDGLARVDEMIRDRTFSDVEPETLALEIALYYGDVVLGAIPGAYWVIESGRFPRVQISEKHFVDMFLIAPVQIKAGQPFLCQAFDRIVQFGRRAAGRRSTRPAAQSLEQLICPPARTLPGVA
ncbi:hypothetical protein [Pseudarthrobacter sp. S9]|uniref:hypothetical protein n=1 Tax=Pseudarthrobacter sp. S9 TaxID=3418421 RepID=UPI003CFD8844